MEKNITTASASRTETLHLVKEFEGIECVFIIQKKKVMKHLKKFGLLGI